MSQTWPQCRSHSVVVTHTPMPTLGGATVTRVRHECQTPGCGYRRVGWLSDAAPPVHVTPTRPSRPGETRVITIRGRR
jgi:hypothetical protein